MVKALRKYTGPLIIIAVASLTCVTFVFIGPWKRASDKEKVLAAEAASYKGRPLPDAPLIELKTGDDYSERVKGGDVLLVYLTAGCAACDQELRTLAENGAALNPDVKVYGVMFQDQETSSRYIQKYDINFPVLLDRGGKLRQALGVKYFPTNFKLNDGTIKEVRFGFPNAKEEFLQMVNLRRS